MSEPLLTWAVAEVPLALVREQRNQLRAEHFTPREVAELRRRHLQSTAGALAVKRALCQLVRQLFPGRHFTERDFVLDHNEVGAPVVRELSPTVPIPSKLLAISLTHTRRRALGLAVVCWEP